MHGVVSGYNRIRANDGARSLSKNQVQGDVGAQKVDPQVGSTRAFDMSKGEAPSSTICSLLPLCILSSQLHPP